MKWVLERLCKSWPLLFIIIVAVATLMHWQRTFSEVIRKTEFFYPGPKFDVLITYEKVFSQLWMKRTD